VALSQGDHCDDITCFHCFYILFSDINTSGNQGQASVEQILFTGMGPIGKFPYLIALINKELVIYQGFKYPSAYNDHLCIRFSKVCFILSNISLLLYIHEGGA
jgi:hypothetical protein